MEEPELKTKLSELKNDDLFTHPVKHYICSKTQADIPGGAPILGIGRKRNL